MLDKNKNIFKVPEGYFDKLNEEILSSADEEQPKARQRFFTPFVRYGVAAAVLLLITFVWINQLEQADSVDDLLSSVSDEALIAFLAQSELTDAELFSELQLSDKEIDNLVNANWEEMNESDLNDILMDFPE